MFDYDAAVRRMSAFLADRLFAPTLANALTEAAARARADFAEAAEPYTDLLIAPFVKLDPERSERLFDTVSSFMGPQLGTFGGRVAAANLAKRGSEVEARNVEKRLNLTPKQRRDTPPWQTADVPAEGQTDRRSLAQILAQTFRRK